MAKTSLLEPSRNSSRNWLDAAVAIEKTWRLQRLPYQIEPTEPHFGWAMVTGRGTGKTLTGANWARNQAFTQPNTQGAVIAPTYRDLRNTVFPALRAMIPPQLHTYRQTNWEMTLPNDSQILGFTGQEPERIRGANLSWAWCDELAFWEYPDDTWKNMMAALRIGDVQVFVSTTPRDVPLLHRIVEDPAWVITRASIYDNPYLSEAAVAQMDSLYKGTNVGRQELLGEFIDEVEGALWTRQMIEDSYTTVVPELKRVVIGVDPSGGRAETGIVVAGVDHNGNGYMLADLTTDGSPDHWARRVAGAVQSWRANKVVAEKNFGGAMVESTLRTHDPNMPVKLVNASRGKIPRAEPVSMLYEQRRVFHAQRSPKLEDQMCTWVDTDKTSPDRMDALVWAFTELMVDTSGFSRSKNIRPGSVTSPSHWRT